MRLRRPVLLSCLALFAFLSCGKAPKSFDSVTVRRPMQPIVQPVNATAAADEALRARQAIAFIVAAGRRNSAVLWIGSLRAVTPTPPEFPVAAVSPTSSNGVNCGGEYPPCYVAQRESGDQYGINTGNGYFGRWQFALSWGGKLGLPADITTATPAQEDEAARLLWANGAGSSHWGVG